MYRVLIVDDEPVIVDGLYEFFLDIQEIELDLYKAYSGDEALILAQTNKIDIAFTDIRMPGMNGIELQKHLTELWPLCKVIFLTGYNDFQYIQAAIRQKGADYILKTESFEAVERALKKVALEISLLPSHYFYLFDKRFRESRYS